MQRTEQQGNLPLDLPSDVGSHEEGEDEEAMGEAYEEISDEEVLEDEGFLVGPSLENGEFRSEVVVVEVMHRYAENI